MPAPAPEGAAALHAELTVVGVVLLIRGARLLQGVLTVAFGTAALEHSWATELAMAIAVIWSAAMARQAWAAGRIGTAHGIGDVVVALLAMGLAAISTPGHPITTSFYWALPYAQSAAMVAAAPRLGRRWATISGPVVLIVAYGLIVGVEAGPRELPAAVGNAFGIAGFYGAAAIVVATGRRLARDLDRAQTIVRSQEEQLAVRRTRLEESRRLHDEAVQVLERAAAPDQPWSVQLRTYAEVAAAHLERAMSHDPAPRVSIGEALSELASLSTGLGFTVEVELMSSLRPVGDDCAELVLDAVREAVTNARKHSQADRAVVRVLTTDTGLAVTVEDRGRGFDAATGAAGFGMRNSIRGRLEEAGGTVTVESSVGAGTTVAMWLPC